MVKFLAALVSFFALIEAGQALPIERFTGAIDLACSPDDVCGTFARASGSLGGKVGVSIEGGRRSKARVRARGSAKHRSLEVGIPGEGVGAFTLSWDGDPHPHQLSSGGLGCLNLRADGAMAFRIESFEVRGACEEPQGTEEGCQSITIEARVYDPSDPTGQRYAASILRRKIPRRGALDIPFSNFIHRGSRGTATFECVGAVSISVKVEGQRGLTLEFGPIETIGKEAEHPPVGTAVATLAPPPRPTETQQPKGTEAPAPHPALVPAQAALEASRSTPRAASSPTRAPTPAPSRKTSSVADPQSSSKATAFPTVEGVTPVERQPLQESVFGEVIAPPATSSPAPAEVKRSRRRLWD
jgi:hypothetical protein